MDVIYSLIPGMMFFGLVLLAVLIWAVKKGQYEDMEGNASRILMDDDEEMMDYPGETTGETTSHPTKQPEDGCQVVGYSHSTRLSAEKLLAGHPKDDSQVAGYAGSKADETNKGET